MQHFTVTLDIPGEDIDTAVRQIVVTLKDLSPKINATWEGCYHADGVLRECLPCPDGYRLVEEEDGECEKTYFAVPEGEPELTVPVSYAMYEDGYSIPAGTLIWIYDVWLPIVDYLA